MKNYIWMLAWALLLPLSMQAQNTIQLHAGASVKMHGGTMGVYGDLVNEATLDFSAAGDIVFYGETWTNTPLANLGVGTAGSAIFVQPNTLYGTSVLQNLDGGGTGVIFPNIQIVNTNNLQLINTDSKIRVRLFFDQGCFILNNQNLTVGDGNPGAILQYDENRFVVTNAGPTATSGFLIREQVGAPAMSFPVGSAVGDYTPVRLGNNGTPDNFRVRVFQNVFADGTSGTLKNAESVGRTWNIEEAVPGGSDVGLILQHNLATEGPSFDPNSNYVARYIGTNPNSEVAFTRSKWDYVGAANCDFNRTPGNITTGAPIATAARNRRPSLDDFTNFTYYTAAVCLQNVLPIELSRLYVSGNADCTFRLNWQTASEENVAYFSIEGSTNGVDFEPIGQEVARNMPAEYSFEVNIAVDDVYYLRLKTIDQDGTFAYSSVVAYNKPTDCQTAQTGYSIYPNPVQEDNQLTIRIHDPLKFPQEGRFIFTDVLGRSVLYQPLNINAHQQVYNLDISPLSVGTYFVHYHANGNAEFTTQKLIIAE